jgi:hypothetical protein
VGISEILAVDSTSPVWGEKGGALEETGISGVDVCSERGVFAIEDEVDSGAPDTVLRHPVMSSSDKQMTISDEKPALPVIHRRTVNFLIELIQSLPCLSR